jgi:endonuclease YncB( thermonuclease family)
MSLASRKHRSEALLFGGIGVAALLAVVAAAYLPGLVEPAQRAERNARPVTPPQSSVAAAPSPGVVPVSPKLQAEPVAPRPPAARPETYRISWPFDIADGITFGPEGAQKTRLAGLEAPPRDAVCNDRNGQPWACGLQARALLNNVTRRQNLVCLPVAEPAGGIVPARCSGEVDVARELVLAGFARPVSPDPALDAALGEAQRSERGLWNGGWTIRTAIR